MLANVDAPVAVPVGILHKVLEVQARAIVELELHYEPSLSQGLASASDGKAAKASSSACRSQMVLLLTRFGGGIRPSNGAGRQ